MENVFEKIIEQLSAYEILNNIIPGAIFVVLADRMTMFSFQTDNVVADMVIFYLAGLIIGRVGSLVIEKFLKRIRFVIFAPYTDYVKAEKKDNKVQILSNKNNVYRSLSGLGLCLVIAIIFDHWWSSNLWFGNHPHVINGIFATGLMIFFAFAFRKQTGYVKDRGEKVLQINEEQTPMSNGEAADAGN